MNQAQEDLKKAKEQLVAAEKEKAQAINELKEAQKSAEEANEKLREALVAQKRAEEDSEIEKFRAVEMEQAGIEAAQKKEDEWQREVESVRSQHALDVAALLSATQELQRVKQELAMTADAKNQALSHADDATKIAEIHAEKAEILSAELTRLKALLDSRTETEANESSKMVAALNSEIDSLKQELEKAKTSGEALAEREASIEQLNVDLEAARMAESYARNLVQEWKQRVEELEIRVEEATRLEKSATESLESVMQQLKGNNGLLHDAESKITALKEKVGLLEISIGRQKGDFEESERRLEVAKQEASEMGKMVESLKAELETVKEEKAQALNNEKLAASSVQNLLEEKNELLNDLENLKDEEEKSKKAMESLASALHEVSSEAREAKEKLLVSQGEHEMYETQIEDLKMVLKATNEKYETMLDEAKHEAELITTLVEQSKNEFETSKAEWGQQELHLVNCVKLSQEHNASLEKEVNRLMSVLAENEKEACAKKEEGAKLKTALEEAESEVTYLKEVLGEAKAESMRLKESLLDKENELQNDIQENEELRSREAASLKRVEELSEELRSREAASLKRIEELSKLLEEATAKKETETEENEDLSDSEKDYDLLPKVVEFSEENGNAREEKPKKEIPSQQCEEPIKVDVLEESKPVKAEAVQTNTAKFENLNGKPKDEESKEKEDHSVEGEFKMWESCKIEEKDYSPEQETEHESFEEDVDSKAEGGDSFDQINGLSSENLDNGGSPTKQQQQKKKKPLLRKFGSLLKKKGTTNQK